MPTHGDLRIFFSTIGNFSKNLVCVKPTSGRKGCPKTYRLAQELGIKGAFSGLLGKAGVGRAPSLPREAQIAAASPPSQQTLFA